MRTVARRSRPQIEAGPEGCDPAIFSDTHQWTMPKPCFAKPTPENQVLAAKFRVTAGSASHSTRMA